MKLIKIDFLLTLYRPICYRGICCRRVSVRHSLILYGRIELVFGMKAFFTYATLCCKEIRVPPKIRVLPSGTLLQILNVENFATAGRSRCRQNVVVVVVVDGRVC